MGLSLTAWFLAYLKKLNKVVTETQSPEEQEKFQKGAAKAMKYLVDMHGDLDFMVGEGPEAHSGQYVDPSPTSWNSN
jgi:hypothetical protein